MQHSEQLNELAAALAKAQGAMRPALKDSANPFFKSRYADLASVIEAAREALADNGLAVSSHPSRDEQGGLILSTYLLHSSGQWMRSDYPVNPVKQDPQGEGSAVTYARRYALMSILNIATSDDDAEAAMGRNDDRHGQQPRGQTRHNHTRDQLPEAFGGPRREPQQAKRRGRPPKDIQEPAYRDPPEAYRAPEPRETSSLYQEVMETILEAGSPDELATASELAMGLTDEAERTNARNAYRNKQASFKKADTGAAARDAIKAGLTLPRPA